MTLETEWVTGEDYLEMLILTCQLDLEGKRSCMNLDINEENNRDEERGVRIRDIKWGVASVNMNFKTVSSRMKLPWE